jgi:hypothetical protein
MTEPAAWGVDEGEDNCIDLHDLYFVQSDAQHMAKLKGPHAKAIPLYAVPLQREWQQLNAEDIKDIEGWVEFKEAGDTSPVPLGKLVLYISHKLREKNT